MPLNDWIKDADRFMFFEKHGGSIISIPEAQVSDFQTIGNVLNRRSFGLDIGTFKKHHFIPSHDLALSTSVHDELPAVQLDKEQAIQFLRKENLSIGNSEKGWHLANFKGINLGWMKVLDNRINNYLPTEWRIRMK